MTNSEIRDLGLTDSNSGCACCSPSGHASAAAKGDSMSTSAPVPPVAGSVVADYLVEGMTCSHCVSSVTEELSAIPGVADVNVTLNAGGASRVTVASASPLNDSQVRVAVEEAGYSLVPVS